MSFSSEVKEELEKLKVWDNNSQLKQEEQIKRVCLREAFISSGFINNPNKKYHLEMIFKEVNKAKDIQMLLQSSNINAKIIERGKNYVIYLKDGEEISNFLALIGASSAVLKFEETRVIKDTRNNINRIINCENANMEKIINASVKQIEAIEYLIKTNKLSTLSENLQEMALIRKDNPTASLEELGKMLSEPIGKSGVNHRLKKIINIADELKTVNGDGEN